jgi:glycosyltransferase involved in cell wall biosynthesis
MIWACYKYSPDLLIGIDMVPHSFNAVICSKLFNIPVIGSLRGMPETYFRGSEKPFMPYILKNLDVLTTTGNKSKIQMTPKFPNREIYVLPNSIDTTVFIPSQDEKIYDIVNVGRLHPSKNLDLLMNIVYLVKDKLPNIKVGIIGNGPDQERLLKICEQLNLTETVTFLGYNEHPDWYYKRSRLFILPTEREGLPMSLIEAMCCGCVPIVTRIGDIEDLCFNNENAILIDNYKDIEAFAYAAIQLLEGRDNYLKLSCNAAQTIQKFNYNSASQVWNSIFSNLINILHT